jgi:hypothetical protein
MLRVRTRRRAQYQSYNDYPDKTTPLSILLAIATPATLNTRTANSVTLSISTASIRQTVTQYISTALTTVTILASTTYS